jgi:hypothetical protein
MDAIGNLSYVLPGIGEFSDAIWAPVSAFIFYLCFGGWSGAAGSVFNFIEEILPGTDFIPSFTIMWFIQDVARRKQPKVVTVSAQYTKPAFKTFIYAIQKTLKFLFLLLLK